MTPSYARTAAVVLTPVLLSVLLVGCGDDATRATGSSGPTSGEPAASSPPATSTDGRERPDQRGESESDAPAAEVPPTLDFAATTVAGEPFEGASLAGRPTLLWFWAPWCPTCRSQIPQVEGLAETHASELNVVGVGSLDSAEAIADFAGDVQGVTHLEDTDGALFRRFGIAEQSSFVLLDAGGTVAFETGYGGSEDLDQQVGDVLG